MTATLDGSSIGDVGLEPKENLCSLVQPQEETVEN